MSQVTAEHSSELTRRYDDTTSHCLHCLEFSSLVFPPSYSHHHASVEPRFLGNPCNALTCRQCLCSSIGGVSEFTTFCLVLRH
jgi:hypothetical protein